MKGLQFIEACLLSGGMDNSCRLYGMTLWNRGSISTAMLSISSADLRIHQPQRVYDTHSGVYSLQGDADGRLLVGLANGMYLSARPMARCDCRYRCPPPPPSLTDE